MDNNQNKNQEIDKQFGLSTLSVKNRTTVFVLLFIILVAGISAYTSMPKEAFPEVITPEIYVGTPYPGNSALDIERLITRPIEKELKSITGVDKINSTSIQGYSTIQVKFDFSVEPKEALRKVKDAVDKARGDADFPQDLPVDPNIFEMNFSELTPIMNVNLSGDYTMKQLKEYAEILEDKIEDLPQISKVDIRGIPEREMKVLVDLHKMESTEISFQDIENAIRSENITTSGGDLLIDGYNRNVRVIGEFTSVEELENLVVKSEKQELVYLKDIAEIRFEGEDPKSFARQSGKPVVMLDIMKRAGENLLDASDEINKIIAEAKQEVLPTNLVIKITGDQSDQTRTQVDELENSIIFGMLLVILVLLFFLGLRNALFVGIAIPISMFLAFMVLGAFGVTLNMMVLFSLILALGMLVDNGIVVVENIYRLMDEGYNSIDAAIKGVGEVAWPIIASTATTLAAFVPLALWPGLMGEFMKYLPITLMIVLGSSLFVALVINPVLTAVFMKVKETRMKRKKLLVIFAAFVVFGLFMHLVGAHGFGNFLIIAGIIILVNYFLFSPATTWFQEKLLPKLEDFYERVLTYALHKKRPLGFFFGTIGLLLFSFILMGLFPPKVEFFPINMPNYVNVFIEMPIGTDIHETNQITKRAEEIVYETINKEKYLDKSGENYLVQSVIAQVGEGASDPMEGVSMGATPEKARIMVAFVKFQDRKGVLTSKVMKDIRKNLKEAGIPGVQITVDKDPAGPPQPKPINIELSGDDYFKLMEEAEELKKFINDKAIAGIEELKIDIQSGKPEMPITIDRAKARRLGISSGMIGSNIRTALFGKDISTYKDGEDDYDIVLRFNDEQRYDESSLMNQRITFRSQSDGRIYQVPISSVANSSKSTTFSAVKRKNLKRVITIFSNVIDGYNANEIVEKIKANLDNYESPEDINIKFTGQQEEQEKEMAFLSTALMIAVFLILIIIVAQFNSISTPAIILLTVILSLIGVFLGLVIFRMDFIIIMTMIGLISLAGIVVNNAIVLIDFINLIQDRKKKNMGENERLSIDDIKDAIIKGGKRRLRPVLLTAITTILGLLPLAVGMNINFFTLISDLDPQVYIGGDNVIFWGPMSWTIIFGLTFTTFLTLVIVPIMYYLFKRLKISLSNFLLRTNVIKEPWNY